MSTTVYPKLIDPSPDAPERPRFGRVEAYVHSDSITQNKGGVLVRVICDSEAGSRTQLFIKFAASVAKYAYAASATCWSDIVQVYPEMGKELSDTRIALAEDVQVTKVVVLKV